MIPCTPSGDFFPRTRLRSTQEPQPPGIYHPVPGVGIRPARSVLQQTGRSPPVSNNCEAMRRQLMWSFKQQTVSRVALLGAVALLAFAFGWPLLSTAQDKST